MCFCNLAMSVWNCVGNPAVCVCVCLQCNPMTASSCAREWSLCLVRLVSCYAVWPAAQAHTRLHVWTGFDIISRHCGTEVIREGRAWIRKDIWLDL